MYSKRRPLANKLVHDLNVHFVHAAHAPQLRSCNLLYYIRTHVHLIVGNWRELNFANQSSERIGEFYIW